MKIAALAFGLCVLTGGLLAQTALNPTLDRDVKTLSAAKSLKLKFQTSDLIGAPVEGTLEYSKPNLYRIETPDRLTVSDGTTVWDYDKKAKTYTEQKADQNRLKEKDVLAWLPFFDKDAFKEVTRITPGTKRAIKGAQVQEVVVEYPNGTTETVFVSQENGAPRGSLVKIKDANTLTTATEMALSDTELPASEFSFTPPADAKKLVASTGATFAQANAIFQDSCAGCHNASRPAGGFDMTTYQGIMAGGRSGKAVMPGNSKDSLLVQLITGAKRPKMPKGGELEPDQIKTIESWIDAGAKQ